MLRSYYRLASLCLTCDRYSSIMKARKTMKNQQLIQEVIAQIAQRFQPKIPDIKKVSGPVLCSPFDRAWMLIFTIISAGHRPSAGERIHRACRGYTRDIRLPRLRVRGCRCPCVVGLYPFVVMLFQDACSYFRSLPLLDIVAYLYYRSFFLHLTLHSHVQLGAKRDEGAHILTGYDRVNATPGSTEFRLATII